MGVGSRTGGCVPWACTFLEGLLVGLLSWSVAYGWWEDQLVDRMVALSAEGRAVETDEDRALAIMDLVHVALKPRLDSLGLTQWIRPLKLTSTDSQLIVPQGHCGSFAHVLARTLQRAGFEVRIAQMLSRGIWGDHIVVEAQLDGRWVVLDGYYNLAFRGQDGALLGFKDVGAAWEEVRSQCPPGYKDHYRYEAVRYTNWLGMPVAWLGAWVDEFSLRAYLLNRYWVVSLLLLFALLGTLSAHGWWWLRMRRRRGNRADAVLHGAPRP